MADQRKILIVEDDVLIGMMLVDMLDALGLAEPAQATTIDEAEAIIDAGGISAALVDINLGETKGWPIADRLESHSIPFAFTSGGGDIVPPEHAHRALVSKPFRLAEIDSVLQNLLSAD